MRASVAETSNESPPQPSLDRPVTADSRGKHRIQAELKRLEQEARFLEKEIEELEATENVSITCQDLIQSVAARPDPLLPITVGPVNPAWDRWFEGLQNSKGHGCQIM
ncbi:guanine nucleotide-binding protein subunit gamma 2 [Nymphaea colorata]|uniref:guanine nucleotide-binding protein subunit gamma 2 n=1 Tax=Nymphaea colorata TaxID=210225 RepID=UPI00129D290C|nr:guanine nucleotide-binding protein subunit gamma 2 [Nymphaea colorata]